MTLRARIVAALLLAAVVPMAVVLVVPMLRAGDRARAETSALVARTHDQAQALLDQTRAEIAATADRAAADLAANREALVAVVRGPETVAAPVARTLAERYALDRVAIRGASGALLAEAGASGGGVALLEERAVPAGSETLTLAVERDLGDAFVSRVRAILGTKAALGGDPAACGPTRAEVPVAEGATLCATVAPADPRDVRRDLLRSFAGTAPFALLAALAIGLLLAARIARPIRTLAERAEDISERHAGPLSLLPEKDETRRLTLAFDAMLDGLAASERRRLAAERVAAWEEIARRLAHEIKNPLSPIRLAVENLRRTRERAPGELDRALAEETATILEEVDALRRLVDEFSQFARLPKAAIAPCDPRVIVSSVLGLYAARIEALSVAVAVDASGAPATIRADAEQVGRALRNVVQNALDAMEGVSERRLTVRVGTEDGGRDVAFEVTDTGPGFGPEALRRVFEPYFTTRGERGGTGLGMAIAFRIAAEHGGSVRADDAGTVGARVALVLPVAGPPADR